MSQQQALTAEKELMTVEIPTDRGVVKLSPSIVRRYLVNGNGSVTDQEVSMFLALCKYQGLNPFLREAYLIKYGNTDATIVVGKETFTKRAHRNPRFKGFKAGVISWDKERKAFSYTDGLCPPDQEIVGGWAEVHMEHWMFPVRVEVDLQEYLGKTKEGQITKMWREKKATLIRKTALVQALREAMPEDFGGMYSEEEISTVDNGALPRNPVPVDDVIDVGEQQQLEKSNVVDLRSRAPEPMHKETPPSEDQPQRRSRRNKFKVDPNLFGGQPEIITCGCTPEQMLELGAIATIPEKREKIVEYLKGIGYESRSFLREDEAQDLINRLGPAPAAPAPLTNGNEDHEATQNPSTQSPPVNPAPRNSEPDDLVTCPMNGGDRLSRSGYCLTSCHIRKKDGFCPVLGETPDVEVLS